LIDRLRRTNSERGLLGNGDRVLVAVSGGPDSLALLHALASLRDELRLEVVAAHLNHRMRGDEGDADAAFVSATAAAWRVPVEVGCRDVPRLSKRTDVSLEEAGRAARYRFFGRAARRAGCNVIATGHTADDRAETVLLNLLRGTGLDGLAGIPARRPLGPDRQEPWVVRPLIDVTRAQVLDYCVQHHLEPRHDVTNESPAFLRNRLRGELLPVLEAEYSPTVRRQLLRLADLAESETALLNAQASALLDAAGASGSHRAATLPPGSESLRVARSVLLDAPVALARRALRVALQLLQPGPPPGLDTVNRLLSLTRGELPGFPLPGGTMRARVTDKELVLEPANPSHPFELMEPIPLSIPGVARLPWAESDITARVLDAAEWMWSAGGKPCLRAATTEACALVDLHQVAVPLMVRPPQPGDRIQPIGMTGHRKLQDVITDRKIPRAARRRLPVVIDARRIVWVAGLCVGDSVKVTARTRAVLLLIAADGLHSGGL
jgi:tRNA(Ile)-lysidine synthase